MIDLIDECGADLSGCGYICQEAGRYNVSFCELFVDSKKRAKELGFDMGHYFILNAPNLSLLMPEHRSILTDWLKDKLSFLLREQRIRKRDKVLFVGIGNSAIIADSFGTETVAKIPIEAFKRNNRFHKIIPNTFSNTGISAFDIIRLIVEFFDISCVVMFDSLATKSIDRLGCSLQINDAGLTPGSALNNFGKALNYYSLNVPCIAVGVPMMISSNALGKRKDIILTEKDVQEKVDYLSSLVAEVVKDIV
ncbi:MAG: GPR endopeptidase [Clostridia bacterium]|nr:GPR endopeptidase [Clostridia bacterium]